MKRANQDMKNFQSGMSSSLKKLAGAFAGVFAVKKIIDFGKESYKAYNEMAINEAKLATVMKSRMNATDDSIASVKQLIAAQEGLGVVDVVAQTAAAQELATYLDTASGLKAILPTMNDMIAQQYGMSASAEQATQIATMLGKVLDGQTGALKRYGYNFDKAQEKILKYGTEAQRVSLVADIIRDSIGDMNAELGKTPQGQMKQIGYTFDAIKMTIGSGIMPILQKILPYIQAIANAFLRAAQFASAFISAFFGSVNTDNKMIASQVGSVEDLGSAYDDVGKKAKKAKKAQKSVAGFDQLNLVGGSSNTKDGEKIDSIGAAAGNLDSGLFSGLTDSMDNVSSKAKEMAEKVKNAIATMKNFIVQNKDYIIAALAGLAAAFTGMWLAANGGAVAKGAMDALKKIALLASPLNLIAAAIGVIVSLATLLYLKWDELDTKWKAVGVALLGSAGLVVLALKLVENNLDSIKAAALYVWDNVLNPFGSWLASGFVAAWNGVSKAAEWLWKNILVPFGGFVTSFNNSVIKPLAAVLKDALGVAFKFVADVAKDLWNMVLVPFGNFIGNTFSKIIQGASDVFSVWWKNVLKPLGSWISDNFGPVFVELGKAITYVWQNVMKPFSEFMLGNFQTILKSVFSSIGTIIKGLETTFGGLIDFITGVFTGNWKKAWEGVKTVFKGVFDTLYGIVKAPLDLIVDAVNTLIGGLNKFKIDLPDWAGGGSFGLDIPRIPKLAKGGLAFGPTLAMVGDNRGAASNPEVIAPLNQLENMMNSNSDPQMLGVLNSILRAIQSGQNINVSVSQNDVYNAAVGGIKDHQRRTGGLPFPV
ncbi:hypothetical protein RE628_11510 [Paenibacillus sp. D2_2]|uniref:phage tail protein n=1 Tax=Paenibacillus sp. D2_2 TaxID=3073092 RepID=UPI00281521D5|nr:hypothetical protein [Paenibacillus sp. D2_2]WMT42852.1 hypothetical protein RE628_11510 [Paenibacillus sp. D2_2]